MRWLAIVLMPIAMASCLGSDSGPAPSVAGGSMQGAIDGSGWAAQYVQYSRTSTSSVEFLGGRDNGGTNPTVVYVALSNIADTGMLALTSDTAASGYAYLLKNGVSYPCVSGLAHVTQDDSLWFKAMVTFTGQDATTLGTQDVSVLFQYKKK